MNPTQTVEEHLIELLKPALDESLEVFHSTTTDVRAVLSKKDGEYRLEISSWCDCERYFSSTLVGLPEAIQAGKDPEARKRLKIARLQRELEDLQKA